MSSNPRTSILIPLFTLLIAQAAYSLDPDRTLTQALQRIWQVPQGLPQATIYSIQQSKEGYLWLGTQTGLVRFDGVRFVSIGEPNWIRDLVEDKQGALWVATNGSGLIRVQNGISKTYSPKEGLPSDNVHSLFFSESTGNLWIGTAGGLAKFDHDKFVVYRTAEGLPTDNVRAMCETKEGVLWVGGDSTQLGFWNGKAFTAKPLKSLPAYTSVRAMLCAADGAIWVGTSNGLVRLKDGEEKRFTEADGLADDWVYCLTQGRDGTIWVGTKDGFSRLRNGGEMESFHAKDGLSQSTVFTLFEDREGDLWVGTKHGLNQFLDRRTVPFTASEGLASNNSGPVLQDSKGNIWVGTLDAGLSHFDGRRFSVLTTQQGLASNSIRALADGGEGLWVGTDKGVSFLRKDRVDTTYTQAQGLPANDVRCLFRDGGGMLWAGTAAGPAVLRDGRFVGLEGLEKPLKEPVVALIRCRDGALCFSTENGGLFHYANQKLNEIAEEGLARRDVDAFYEDVDGLLWIGTLGGGLRLFENGKISRYSMRDGLFDDEIYGIVCDDQDRLWMACSKGIFYVSRSDLRKFAAGEIKSFVSTPFSPTEGLRTIECKSGVQPAAWRMNDGRLWFSTIRGVIVVDPTKLVRKLPPTPVVIEEVIVNGKREEAKDVEELPPGVKNLEFRYTALSFLVPGRITFRYRLEGFDKDWIEAAGRHEAFYTNLPPGPYRFRVAALNVDGTSSEAAGGVAFVLQPHFYQRRWFVPACVAMVVALAWLGYRLRVRRIKAGLVAILGERSRIARELHDTLLQGFSGVTMEMQALSARLPNSAEQSTLHEIIRDAATCMTEARRSVAGLRGATGSESGLAAAIERTARQITEARDVRLKLNIGQNAVGLPADVEYHLLRIAAEAITNSVKHAGARNIEVTLDCTPRIVKLRMTDDGSGFVRNNGSVREHYGLIGMEERAKQIGADFQLRSEPSLGTTVSVELRRET